MLSLEAEGPSEVAAAAAKLPAEPNIEAALATKEKIPISAFPPLLPRHNEYWIEPLCGICFVLGSCGFFVAMVRGMQSIDQNGETKFGMIIAVQAIEIEAIVAVVCLLYLLFGGAGVTRRSEKTCYPMPAEVEEALRKAEGDKQQLQKHLADLSNIPGPEGDTEHGTYCVRCLVWRPHRGSHHCSTCQRCVTHFDHHCGVFGRCIVGANMPCFGTLIAMFPAAFFTLVVAILASAVPHYTLVS